MKVVYHFVVAIALCIQFLFCTEVFAQSSSSIIITGQAIDAITHRGVKPLQIINKRNIQRFYGDSTGNFVIQVSKNDTLYFVAKGYATVLRCYKDSASKNIFILHLRMYRISVELPEVIVQSNRDFGEVHEQAQKLGYDKKDYMVHGYQIIQSPFTYLYQLLSTREKDKRGYALLMNEGKKKELVSELVTNYVSLDILNLDPSQIHDFVEYIEVPENFLKTTNEYDFIRFLQRQVDIFHQRRLPATPEKR